MPFSLPFFATQHPLIMGLLLGAVFLLLVLPLLRRDERRAQPWNRETMGWESRLVVVLFTLVLLALAKAGLSEQVFYPLLVGILGGMLLVAWVASRILPQPGTT